MEEKKFIFKGVNSHILYSIYTCKERMLLFAPTETLEALSKIIFRNYPEASKIISKFYENEFFGDLPEEIDLSRLDPSERAELIKLIAFKVGREKLLEKNKV